MEKGKLELSNQKSNSDDEYLLIPKRICRQSHMYDDSNNTIWTKLKSLLNMKDDCSSIGTILDYCNNPNIHT